MKQETANKIIKFIYYKFNITFVYFTFVSVLLIMISSIMTWLLIANKQPELAEQCVLITKAIILFPIGALIFYGLSKCMEKYVP